MFKNLARLVYAGLCVCMAAALFAHPVSYKGGKQLMVFGSHSVQYAELYTTYTSQAAYGVHAMQLRKGSDTFGLGALRHNWLLKRWNLPSAQANVYAGLGAGAARENANSWQPAAEGFLQADYETRRIYTAARVHAMASTQQAHVWNTAAVGWAPYAAEYDELNTWFLLKGEYITNFHKNIEVTPTLRLFWGNKLVELGVSTQGELKALWMLHF